MNSYEIGSLANCLIDNFAGIFSANETHLIKHNQYAIINTQKSTKPGKHWIVIKINNDVMEYFDPLAAPPSYYQKEWESLASVILLNTRKVQSNNSISCGLFCLYFIIQRLNGTGYEEILQNFSFNLDKNDYVVSSFINNLILDRWR